MIALNDYLQERKAKIDKALDNLFDPRDRSSSLVAAMCHSLLDSGKRLRPILCMAACDAVGGQADSVVNAACALELIHTYSLIHDDLPAMDNDSLRRGKPTCHVAFDEATAILAGDALLTMAFEILADSATGEPARGPAWIQAIAMIARAAGYRGMVEGQVRDIHSQSRKLGIEALEAMHRLKTGALIEASVRVGVVLAEGHRSQIDALAAYARHIGLAFQIADDILNVEGDPAIVGKSVGSDRQLNKNTYPSLMGLGPSKKRARHLVQMALQALDGFDNKADPLRAIAAFIVEREA